MGKKRRRARETKNPEASFSLSKNKAQLAFGTHGRRHGKTQLTQKMLDDIARELGPREPMDPWRLTPLNFPGD